MILSKKNLDYIKLIPNSLFNNLMLSFIYNSNHIEGSTFSEEALSELISSGLVSGNHSINNIIKTKNSLDVFNEVVNTCDRELDKYWIWDIHRLLKRGTTDEAGRWKIYDNRITGVGFKTSPVALVDSEMFNLIEDWKVSNKILEDIALFHSRFERIHPFQDGNGRVGRFIVLKQCLEAGVDLISIDATYEKDYKSALLKSQTDNDISDLVDVFTKCQHLLDSKLSFYNSSLPSMKTASELYTKN